MPLVHFEVRNEYGLGDPDVYRTAQKDDSRALLEGVAVVGLVGILRQLGDLAEFAAETFRGLHDKVSSTAARSQNMMARIQRLEAGLPSLEKAALSQSSHIHFAYIAGSGWHASVRTEQNHLTRDDLPGFIMDSYDECRGPPRLFLLDKFDAAGAGACLKRYSDPSFFKMERVASELTNSDKVKREKTSKKISRTQRNAEALSTGSLSRHYRRSLTTPHHCGMFYTLDFDEKNQNADDLSFVKYEFKKEPSQTKSSYMECLLDVDETCEPGKVETYALCSSLTNEQCIHVETSMISDDQANSFIEDTFFREPSCCENNPGPLRITWDEKTEAETLATSSCGSVLKVETQSMAHRNAGFSEFRSQEGQFISIADRDHHEIAVDDGKWPKTCAIEIQKSEAVSEPDNYVDARNIMGSEVESDYEGRIKRAPEFQHVHKELGMRSVVDKQETCDISDNCGIETPSTSTSLLNDELAEGFSQANIPDNNNLGTPAVDVFENEVDAVPDIEMRKETVFHSVKDKSADRADFSDRQAAASYIYMSDLNNSAISCSVKQATSTNFWTNGGLLGLQSSKPPDFGATKVPEDGHEVHRFIADAASQCSPANLNGAGSFGKFGGNTETLCEPRSGKEYGKYEAHPDVSQLHHSEVVQDPSCIIESHADEFQKRHMQRCDGFFEEHWDSTTIGSSIKVEGYNDSNWVKTEEADISFSGGKLPVLSSTEVQSTGSTLTNKCLANSLQWKSVVSQLEFTRNSRNNGTMLSDTGVTINTMLNIPKKQYAEIFSQPSHMDALSRSTCIEEPGCGSPRNLGSPISECSSPIMEHMKISFNPGNNLELSAVNLEHPVGHNLHDIIKDTFSPSFSWLPQPIVPLRELRFLSLNCGNSMDMPSFEESVTSKRADSELDSDDDSFCKPSLNFSDDMLSQDLESNSGHWESNDINGIRDDLCNGLRRISSAASVSSSIGLEETTHCSVDPDHHDPEHCSNEISSVAEVVDFSASRIQNFQTQVLDKDFWQNKRVTSVLPNSLAMQPLSPPKQLKHINSPVCSAKDQGHCLSFPVSQAKSVQTLEAVDPCQSKSGAPMSLMEPTTSHGNSRVKHIWQADERDILLEEIRAKPFNLKPAVKRRPVASSTTPTTSISVAAFLEKANAIRQAFAGSDDGGEDDE